MPELRQNMATREWVIIATERARRPEEFAEVSRVRTHTRPQRVEKCPFCPGNEHMTPAATLAIEDGEGWGVRVFNNLYSALGDGPVSERVMEGLHRHMSGVGRHEVVVESPRHNTTTALMSVQEVARFLRAFQVRTEEASRDERVLLTICFKNHGAAAGASLEHPHGQILCLPVVPLQLRSRAHDAMTYFDEHGSCVFCDMWRQEIADGVRVVVEGKHSVSFVPFAAFSPFHIWIVPKRHAALFVQTRPDELEDIASVLRTTLAKLYWGLGDPDYNWMIRAAPNHHGTSRSYHWYLSVVPRVSKMAGFELGAGMFINSALPEQSARFLREVQVPDVVPST
jgi:UDPglucose--hexose-1-phosphate uridylyltransferase